MASDIMPILFFLNFLQRRAGGAAPPEPRSPVRQAAAAHPGITTQRAAPPSPDSGTMPALPSGWVPDVPLSPGVAQRAREVLSLLWSHGPGAYKIENTQGIDILYRAQPMNGKHGVVAYKRAAAAQQAPAAPSPAPAVAPDVTPHEVPPVTKASVPTLRYGDHGPAVAAVQADLGIPIDGKFGTQTKNAVEAFQRKHGLDVDGVVGHDTWIALGKYT